MFATANRHVIGAAYLKLQILCEWNCVFATANHVTVLCGVLYHNLFCHLYHVLCTVPCVVYCSLCGVLFPVRCTVRSMCGVLYHGNCAVLYHVWCTVPCVVYCSMSGVYCTIICAVSVVPCVMCSSICGVLYHNLYCGDSY